MNCTDVLNLVAIIFIPIVAVVVGQWLQNRSEKRRDKMQIFKVLMSSRIYGWTNESVNALNVIDVVFVNDKGVRNAWKQLYDYLNVKDPDQYQIERIVKARYKLLEEIAASLGYRNKITWEEIQNSYKPVGIDSQMNINSEMQENYRKALEAFSGMVEANDPKKKAQNKK